MADVLVKIDPGEIAAQVGGLTKQMESELSSAFKKMAVDTLARVKQLAEEDLSSQMYLKYKSALSFDEPSDGVFVIALAEEAVWIEDGTPERDMKPDLLKNAKTSKSGTRYQIIPFDYGTTASKTPTAVKPLIEYLEGKMAEFSKGQQAEAKKSGQPIPDEVKLRKIERNSDGSPKIGKLHSFDFGGGVPGKGNTERFKGLSIHQAMNEKTGKVERSVKTFRTVTSGPGSADKWHHPGNKPKLFFDKAADEAQQNWDNTVLPGLIDKWSK